MGKRSVPEWMSNEMERLTMKFERYKPSGSGYNRIQPIRLSKCVTQILNNPLPVNDQIGRATNHQINKTTQESQNHIILSSPSKPPRGVLSRTESEWEEVYPTIKFSRSNSHESNDSSQFTHYRNCSTRIT